MEGTALFNKYAEQIESVEMKDLYESFLLIAIEMEDDSFQLHLNILDESTLRAEVSRIAGQIVMPQLIESVGSKQVATYVFVRAYAIIIYLYSMKGADFLSYANSLPEYLFEICAEVPLCWRGEGEYGFFEFDLIALQKRIDEEAGMEGADPLAE